MNTAQSTVTFSLYSPRASGEKAARSRWSEIPYADFRFMTHAQRVRFAHAYAASHYGQVVYRKAITHGHARMFFRSN